MDRLTVNKCPECDNRGYIYKFEDNKNKKIKCPNRWHESNLMESQKETMLSTNELEKLLEEYVPNTVYREIDFDKKELLNSLEVPKTMVLGDSSFEEYVDGMAMIIREVKERGKLTKGYYVWGPENTGKKYFAYSVIKAYLTHGKNPTKLTNLSEYSDAIVTGDYRRINEWLEGKDVVLVTLKGMIAQQIVYGLDYLIERCELKGIPLIVIGTREYYRGVLGVQKTKVLSNKSFVAEEVPNNYYGKLQNVGISSRLDMSWHDYTINKMLEDTTNDLQKRRAEKEDQAPLGVTDKGSTTARATRGPKKKKD